MLTFEIEPLIGVGPVQIGQTRNDVKAILARLGQPQPVLRNPITDCFFHNAFQVSYDDNGLAEFIEVGVTDKFQGLFHGRSLHEMLADDAVRLVSQIAQYDENQLEGGCSYIFPALQLSLWRPFPPDNADDPEGRHFHAVGVGRAGYFGS